MLSGVGPKTRAAIVIIGILASAAVIVQLVEALSGACK